MSDVYIKTVEGGENTTPATNHYIELDDGTDSTYMSLPNLMKIVNSLTADSTPDTAADYLLSYDASTSSAKKVLMNLVGRSGGEGILVNGKISVSVASNNLTVAIKTLAGADPSASDPVTIQINGGICTISAALSVTKNAGTNWCNSGGSELATKEVDYFVYIGYNATDGVVVGFSRIPYASLYSDFSDTSTLETYCAISTIANAAAGDNYTNIGRFAATLSAGAGYTWTVPTFTSANLIQRRITESRWLDWSIVFAGWSANPGYGSTYQIQNRMIAYDYSVTSNGTSNNTTATMSLPFKAAVSDFCALIGYQDNGVTGAPGDVQTTAASNLLSLYKAVYSGAWTNTGVKVMYIPVFSIRLI